MGYAFISYSHSDRQFVERMAQQLRKADIEVWIDHDLTHGERFPDQLEKEIAGSAVFVPVMSKHAQESEWVKKEAAWAKKYQRKIMPVSIDGQIFATYSNVHCEKAAAGSTVSQGFQTNLREMCHPSVQFAANATVNGHRNAARSVAFSPRGDLLVSAGDDRTIRLWEMPGGNPRHVIGGGMAPTWPAAFTPDGTRFAAPSTAQPGIHLWSTAGAALTRTLGNHDEVRSIAFSADGTMLATGGDDRVAHVWDARTGAHRQALKAGRMVPAWPLCFSADGRRLAVANWGSNSVSVWDTASLDKTGRTDLKSGAVTAVAFDPSGEQVLSGGTDGRVELDTVDGASVRDLKPHTGVIHAIACSPDGKVFATAGADSLIKVIALVTGEELQTLAGHAGDVFAVAFSPDSMWIASAGADGTIRLWRRK